MPKATLASGLNDISPYYKGIQPGGRGINVYAYTDLMGIQAIDREGDYLSVKYDRPLFSLTVDERLEIFQSCSPVLGVVTSRMNRLSALEWAVVPDKKNEDRIAEILKYKKAIYDEYVDYPDLTYQIAARQMATEIQQELPEVLPDLSNFQPALIRWKRSIQNTKQEVADQVQGWMEEPNNKCSWSDFVKMQVMDLHVHGAVAEYKEHNDGVLDNIYILPGGTVLPVRSEFVGGVDAYVQINYGIENQIFFDDELVFSNYIPTSARSYGYVPLESVVNKVAETLLFDKLMAEQADGTKPPEKMVVFGNYSPFGDLGLGDSFSAPLDVGEQQRIETVMNESRKNAVRTLTGVGQPVILDLTRENTMGTQMERQKMIREEVALIFNMSNLEINMSDSDGVSGRATSDSLETIDQNKGIVPVARILEYDWNRKKIPYRVGPGYKLEFQIATDPLEELKYYREMVESGLYSVNEVRTQEMGENPFKGEEYDVPKPPAGAGALEPSMAGGF